MDQRFDPAMSGSIRNFCYLGEADLVRAAAEAGLALPSHLLLSCQRLYRERLFRDPTGEELAFFDSVLKLWGRTPEGVRIGALAAEGEDAVIWQDMVQKTAELGITAPPTLPDLQGLCGRALDRAGICMRTIAPTLGTPLEVACRAALSSEDTPLTLGLGHAAALWEAAPAGARPWGTDMLFLLSPAGDDPAAEALDYVRTHRHLGIYPVAFTGSEGLLAHLFSLGGLDVDYALLPGYTPEVGLSVLLEAGRDALLFFAPRTGVNALMGEARGDLVLFGSLVGGQNVTLRAGNLKPLTLPTSFLQTLCATPIITAAPVHREGAVGEVQIATKDDRVLAGVEATADTAGAVLSLLSAAARAGADPMTAQLSTLLLIPGGTADEALPLILDFHRAEAELVLPAAAHRAVQCDALPHPSLAVFLQAKTAKMPQEALIERLKNAAQTHSFSGMRSALYKKD